MKDTAKMQDKDIRKLLAMAEEFKQAYFRQDYSRAKYLYDSALRVAEFHREDIPEEILWQLFGHGAEGMEDDEVQWGMFDRHLVRDCYKQCTIRLYQGYEHESYRRFGQPPRYYPQPRYPVPGCPEEKRT